MAETIKLKSKAVSIYDYHQVDISRIITGFCHTFRFTTIIS